ncbi:succinate dehydrogenase assembly factor 2 [Aestuariivita sp.]|jgi:antitoxin CptB|uniref:succinate dehydrogenase assembly factor 2 n=1 Tax=Aestuariivita sp. TaxID=1872407 RepID=UPI00216C4510|nr:succinate dehydrogenase assembly factor 2 [Aestuariivita sp.]MCE8008424.1 succinate dehydrogenase assembly factor 2 [Aestuariivita sp.]
MSETPEAQIKRLKMRSMRRGIKEMDLILSAYAERMLDGMDEAELALYDRLLQENDQDLYQWVTGQADVPEEYGHLVADIAQTFQK